MEYYLGKIEEVKDGEQDEVHKKEKYWNGDSKDIEVKEVDNHIYFYSRVCKKSAQELNIKLREVEKKIIAKYKNHSTHQEYIYLHINSFGGSVFSAFSIVDTIKSLRVPVISIIEGAVASAGTLISVVCDYRIIFKTSYMLIHQLSSTCWGQMDKLEEEMENLRNLTGQIKNIYKTYTKIPVDELDDILKHDYWWNSDICREKGLVDEIKEGERDYQFKKDMLDI